MSQGAADPRAERGGAAGRHVITAAGTPPGDLLKLWDATGGRDCHIEFGFSCMGYELPAAVGVRLAQPEGEVIAYIGDGTYLLNPGELVTALQHGLKITVVISENHGYQSIRRLQMGRVGREFGNEFRAPRRRRAARRRRARARPRAQRRGPGRARVAGVDRRTSCAPRSPRRAPSRRARA